MKRAILAAMTLAAAPGCGTESADPPADFDMPEYLAEMATSVDPTRNRFANTALLDAMLALPPRSTDRERLLFRLAVAEQTLYAGRVADAVAQLDSLLTQVDGMESLPVPQRPPPTFRESVLDFLAIAHLKAALAERCVGTGNSAACALGWLAEHEPSSSERAHLFEAAALYERMLSDNPDHLGARWLLNVTRMALGTHPGGLTEATLIPGTVLADDAVIQRFQEIAARVALDDPGHVGGAVVDDFDGDGLLDVMATSWGLLDPVHYHRNRGDGTFEARTGSHGLEGIVGGGNLVQADYDNDGDLDAFILRGGWLPDGQPNSLLQNQGDGTFRDQTSFAGLLGPMRPSQTAAWADYDGDGLLDLYVGNETFGDRPYPAQLFRNLGDGSFQDVAPSLGVDVVGIVKGVAWGDYDNDGRPDLYVSRTGAANVLFRNAGPTQSGGWSFEDRTASAGVGQPIDAFATWFWDYDNDGWEDLFVAGYRTEYGDVAAGYLGLSHDSELPRLYRNRGDGTFQDVTADTGLDRILFSMGSNFGDLDNDGWLDHYQATGDPNLQALMPNRMFRNVAGQRFEEVTVSGGFGLLDKGHGVAFADLDHDGDQDVFVTMGGAFEVDVSRNALFENPGGGGRWLALRLVGTEANRSAIGARVSVRVSTPQGPRTVHRTVSSGSSFGGNPLRLQIGLGDASDVESVEVRWPGSGRVDRLTGLQIDSAYRLVEGDPDAVRLERPAFSLGGGR